MSYKQQQVNYQTSLITRSNRTSFGFLAAWLIINLFIINRFLYIEKRKNEKLDPVSFTISLEITGEAKLEAKKIMLLCLTVLCLPQFKQHQLYTSTHFTSSVLPAKKRQ